MEREDLLAKFRDELGWDPSEENLAMAEKIKRNIALEAADHLIHSTYTSLLLLCLQQDVKRSVSLNVLTCREPSSLMPKKRASIIV